MPSKEYSRSERYFLDTEEMGKGAKGEKQEYEKHSGVKMEVISESVSHDVGRKLQPRIR